MARNFICIEIEDHLNLGKAEMVAMWSDHLSNGFRNFWEHLSLGSKLIAHRKPRFLEMTIAESELMIP